MLRHTDAHFCVECDYHVTVGATAAASFTVSASPQHSLRVLEDGSPVSEVVNKNAYQYFKLFLSDKAVDLQVAAAASSGT